MSNTMNVLVFSEQVSTRLIYCLDFCFALKKIPYQLTTDKNEFSSFKGVKLNYSNQKFQNIFSIHPEGLLFEKEITTGHEIKFDKITKQWRINDKIDDLSILFYFLSRYEEYTISARDNIGRFQSKDSVLHQNKQLDIPWCDLIVKAIWQNLTLPYQIVKKGFTIKPSFDIDIAWAYKNKGIWRTILGFSADLLRKKVKKRWLVLTQKEQDPYDTYALIEKVFSQHSGILFFLLGNWGKYDKNTSWKNKELRSLIKIFDQKNDVGIHPSFHSFLSADKIKVEVDRLAIIRNKPTLKSRQHFLKFQMPTTYQLLIENGIQEDYSMGFADQYGFRAGTSFPFYFFDLSQNNSTPLILYPITYMDGTLKEYLNQSPDEACITIQNLLKTVQDVGGYFIPLWHNHSINNEGEWKHWQKVFLANFQ